VVDKLKPPADLLVEEVEEVVEKVLIRLAQRHFNPPVPRLLAAVGESILVFCGQQALVAKADTASLMSRQNEINPWNQVGDVHVSLSICLVLSERDQSMEPGEGWGWGLELS
jgi:hypothetical protein